MGNHQQSVEINGKKYDLAIEGTSPAKVAKKIDVHGPDHHRSIDGFMHAGGKKVGARSIHTRPAKSETLMRRAVVRPQILATTVPIDKTVEDFSARRALEELRLRRAKKIPTSKLVSRFGIPEITSTRIVAQPAEINVKPEPSAPPPLPVHKAHHAAHPRTHNHFEAQIAHATAHTAKPLKKPKLRHRAAKKLHTSPRKLSIGSAVVAVLMLGSFIAYQNASLIAVQMAARKAGVAASVPRYTPGGFSLKTHSAHPGQIIIGYKSNTDGRTFEVTQTASAWDSAALLENYVSSNSYQTVTSKGRTVYLYDGNATWVDNGIWYKIDNKAGLSSDQLQHLVDSI